MNLAVIGALAVILLTVVLNLTIQYAFDELENEEIAAHQGRIATFIQDRLDNLGAVSLDLGQWDDTYDYVLDFNEDYRSMNLEHDSLSNVLVDGVFIGRYSDGKYLVDAFNRETGDPLPGLTNDLLNFATSYDFVERLAQDEQMNSYVRFQDQLFAVAAAQINRNDLSAEPPGYLVVLSEVRAERVSEVLQADSIVLLGQTVETSAVTKSDSRIEISTPILGFDDSPIGQVVLDLPRPLTIAAKELLMMVLGGTVVVVISILLVLQLRMRQLVLSPMQKLHEHLKSVRSSGELQELQGMTREDEFGAARHEFNLMAQELQELRAKLESQSFALGRTQSAIGLMHNLRNSLAPVRVILETLERKVNIPFPPQTERALNELALDDINKDRREKLAQFLAAAHSDRAERDADNQLVVREAARNLMNAFEAINSLQSGEGNAKFEEQCEIAKILSHSCNVARFTDDLDIATDVSVDTPVVVKGNRVLLAQVVENLVTNAVEAIRKTGRDTGTISITAKIGSDGQHCYVNVADDGIGFDPENAQNLFERGYSTREGASGGLGLHWCANTINAMGGKLSMASDGLGQGAKAQIVLALFERKAEKDTLAA